MMKKFTYYFFLISLMSLVSLSFAESESGAWDDIKSGTRKIIKGTAKSIKKGAKRVSDKIDKNMEEDEREDAEEKKKEKKED